jgi:hypothetical protein
MVVLKEGSARTVNADMVVGRKDGPNRPDLPILMIAWRVGLVFASVFSESAHRPAPVLTCN